MVERIPLTIKISQLFTAVNSSPRYPNSEVKAIHGIISIGSTGPSKLKTSPKIISKKRGPRSPLMHKNKPFPMVDLLTLFPHSFLCYNLVIVYQFLNKKSSNFQINLKRYILRPIFLNKRSSNKRAALELSNFYGLLVFKMCYSFDFNASIILIFFNFRCIMTITNNVKHMVMTAEYR